MFQPNRSRVPGLALHVHGEIIGVAFRTEDERLRFRSRWLSRKDDYFTFYLACGGFEKTVQVWVPAIDAVEGW